jgi:NADH dehydrogenase FAD-containing subunit
MKKRVVIAGFGDTGLLAAIYLKKKYDILGISPKPCLVSGQELGLRLTRPEEWKENYLMGFHRFKHLAGVQHCQGRVLEILPTENKVKLLAADGTKRYENYDALLIAAGVSNGFWRTDKLETLEEIQRNLENQAADLSAAGSLAVVGGGPSGVSVASNMKEKFPDAAVHLFFAHEQPLPGYHPKTRRKIVAKLTRQGVVLHAGHRAHLPTDTAGHKATDKLTSGTIDWQTGQPPFKADLILWAVGNLQPNNDFMPPEMLTAQGFVKVDARLRVPGHENIFAVGDIADTDENRSSARNGGFMTAAHNVDAYLSGRLSKMKPFKVTRYRWGSIVGVQAEGLRIFTPTGGSIRISKYWVGKLLFTFFVWQMIYRGLHKNRSN